jgi:hypothetical protein
MNRQWIAVTTLALSLVACASQPSEREMNYLASALTKVSAAVDVTARHRRSADGLNEAQLLQAATAHDPSLMKPFDGMTVRVLREGRDSAVLVCKANGGTPLLEDAGCTANMDVHRWSQAASDRCEFTMNVKQVCAR